MTGLADSQAASKTYNQDSVNTKDNFFSLGWEDPPLQPYQLKHVVLMEILKIKSSRHVIEGDCSFERLS